MNLGLLMETMSSSPPRPLFWILKGCLHDISSLLPGIITVKVWYVSWVWCETAVWPTVTTCSPSVVKPEGTVSNRRHLLDIRVDDRTMWPFQHKYNVIKYLEFFSYLWLIRILCHWPPHEIHDWMHRDWLRIRIRTILLALQTGIFVCHSNLRTV